MAVALFNPVDFLCSDRLSGLLIRILREFQLSEITALRTALEVMKENEIIDPAERKFILSVCRHPSEARVKLMVGITAKSTEQIGADAGLGVGVFTASGTFLSRTEMESVGASEIEMWLATAGSEDFKVEQILTEGQPSDVDRVLEVLQMLLDKIAVPAAP